ncbi:MAG: Bacteriophage repressor helix-turn-helix domain [Symbiobacteriaceae bacterium]|jgi:transcriptional regulator with XRE-family HTH domain|nr:Bacteriophage repressor helix-turn-helix domain [Symbiobacteriaceae bacterium]
MHGRVKQLRMSFGLDQRGFAEVLGCPVAEVAAWEQRGATLSAEDLALLERRFGISPGWLAGGEGPKWGARLLELREWLAAQIKTLAGARLVTMISATTGERIAYTMGLLSKKDPELFTLEVVAAWLGLTAGSTELLLRGELDPGSPVIARASDLTGISERWFRIGPVDLM